MVLGQDEDIDPLREDFRDCGLAHLLAVSGQNVMLLGALAFPLLVAAGLGPARGALAVLAPDRALRAAGRRRSVAAARRGHGRRRPGGHRRVATRLALLRAAARGRRHARAEPAGLGDPGWQLSFAAVLGILWRAGRCGGLLGGLRRCRAARLRRPRAAREGMAVTVAATLATAPLLAHTSAGSPPAGSRRTCWPSRWWRRSCGSGWSRRRSASSAPVRRAARPAPRPVASPRWPTSTGSPPASPSCPAAASGCRWARRCRRAPPTRATAALSAPGWPRRRARPEPDRASSARAAWRRASRPPPHPGAGARLARPCSRWPPPGLAPPAAPERSPSPSSTSGRATPPWCRTPRHRRALRRRAAGGAGRAPAAPGRRAPAGAGGGHPPVARPPGRPHEVLERYPVGLMLDGGDHTRDPDFRRLEAEADRRGDPPGGRLRAQTLRVGALSIEILSPAPRPPGDRRPTTRTRAGSSRRPLRGLQLYHLGRRRERGAAAARRCPGWTR